MTDNVKSFDDLKRAWIKAHFEKGVSLFAPVRDAKDIYALQGAQSLQEASVSAPNTPEA